MNDVGAQRLRVALIDDSEDMRIVALELLGELGLDVLVAERESLKVEELAAWRPNLVVIDPFGAADASRSPFTVLLAMRERAELSETPVVFLADPRTLRQYETDVTEAQPFAALHKPLSATELIEVLRAFMQLGALSRTNKRGSGAKG